MKKIIILFFLSFLFNSISLASTDSNEKICSGFSKWTEDGEFKQIRESKCMTQDEYNAYLNSPDYLCKYYQKSIWKESERAYGKKQYKYTEEKLKKIKSLKEEGKALCDAGNLKKGEAKLIEALTIISFTQMN
jgi:hypothetical protein|tara:strand:+ start:898 stop:1296 length:399 start_codon:yes stop_codon:yes gene_type:complete